MVHACETERAVLDWYLRVKKNARLDFVSVMVHACETERGALVGTCV
jgi:hypothetical protein